MRGLIVIVAIVCLLTPGCSSYTGKPNRWDYMTPEHVTCYGKEIKFCRQYGPRLVCECIV